MFERQKAYFARMAAHAETIRLKKMSNDSYGLAKVMNEILGLAIVDVICLALVPTIATSVVSAQGNVSDPSVSGMLTLVELMFVIVIIVANAVVIMIMLKSAD